MTCVAVKADGSRCGATTTIGPSGLCVWHDPERREAAQEARRKGGKVRHTRERGVAKTVDPSELPGELNDLEDCVRWASWLAVAAATGRVSQDVAREVSRALTTFRQGLEKRDLLRRIKELEAMVKTLKKAGST